ncbi:hypothetical protein [Pseudoalteromonas luteoviolacea]|nr:hypothetical protein [Pseudoalteromonas luteoviolacea]KZN53787.1 hypothetical protein N474_19645 [Pseudoalteromonas luteoviolacea CPMOR-2]
MTSKNKKTILYSISILILFGAAFYASMEDYQKDNLARFLEQVFTPN